MRRAWLVLRLLFLAGCSSSAGAGGDADSNASDVVTSSTLDVAEVDAVLAKLKTQRSSDPIAPWYTDTLRAEGCWRNPAGNKLSDLKKALYCSMPLELRLCNTVVLLTVDEKKRDVRYAGFLDCQRKVDAVFGGKGTFVYDDDVNAMYQKLYLEGGTLTETDLARVVRETKPAYTERSFTDLLGAIGASLLDEATKLALQGLQPLVDAYLAATNGKPR